MAVENVVSIYKIDKGNSFFGDCPNDEQKIEKIITRGNTRISSRSRAQRSNSEIGQYEILPIRDNIDKRGFEVTLYHSRRSVPSSWNSFLSSVLQNNAENTFRNNNHDFIVFVRDAGHIFCFTGGIASGLVEDICDENFPKDLMIRLSDPDKIKQAKSRGLTGAFYARELYFRGNYSISPTEAFGSIWKDVRAAIRDDVWNDTDWQAIIGEKTSKDLNCDVKTSFRVRRKVDFGSAIKLIAKLKNELGRELTEEEKKGFYFLNTIQLIKNKESKEELNKLLAANAFEYLTSGTPPFDYDFCHKSYENFLEADHYIAKRGREELVEWSEIGCAKEVLDDLKDKFDLSGIDAFAVEFSGGVKILSEHDADELKGTKGSIIDHLHGEIHVPSGRMAGTYFLIDKEWCKVGDDFLQILSDEYEGFMRGDCFCALPLNPWTTGTEGSYNESHLDQQDFLVGDRITMDGIELFDLLRYDGENIYIIQVKDGLGASTRDACSQLRNSSRLIEESVKTSECAKLREYHSRLSVSGTVYAQTEKFKAQMRAVGTTDDFVNLFKSRNRVYVLAFRYGNRVEDAVGTGSNIAKFEILGLKDHIKITDAQFKLFQIKDS